MHALIINGSPRVKKLSNTDKILDDFCAGMLESGSTFERYEVSDRTSWAKMRACFCQSDNILIALPLFVECIPGMLLEFLETLAPELAARQASTAGKNNTKKISYILQSGFAEGVQLRCGEAYLEKLTVQLGCEYGGTLVKGNNFSIRLSEGEARDKITAPYREMGRIYGKERNFFNDSCKAFTGPEVFPAPVRLLVGLLFRTAVRGSFKKAARSWGCTKSLRDRPYEV